MSNKDSELLPLEQTCAALDISPPTLQRWIRQGAPQAKPGRRGRGGMALFDPAAIAAWRRREGGGDALTVLAGELSEIVADAVYLSFRLADGSHKRPSADMMAATWYVVTSAILDHIGKTTPVRGVSVMPEKIEMLRRIAEGKFTDPRRAFFDWSRFPQYKQAWALTPSKYAVYEGFRDRFLQLKVEDKFSENDT